MVGWPRAFGGAAATVGWILLWGFIGGLIIAAGIFGGAMISGLSILDLLDPSTWWMAGMGVVTGVVVMIASFIGGYLLIIFGFIATFYKYIAEIAAEEVEKRLSKSGLIKK